MLARAQTLHCRPDSLPASAPRCSACRCHHLRVQSSRAAARHGEIIGIRSIYIYIYIYIFISGKHHISNETYCINPIWTMCDTIYVYVYVCTYIYIHVQDRSIIINLCVDIYIYIYTCKLCVYMFRYDKSNVLPQMVFRLFP